MNIFSDLLFEAKLIGFKEGLKIAVVWLVFYSYLKQRDRLSLIKWFYAGLFICMLIPIPVVSLYGARLTPVTAGNFITMSFALFLIASGVLLFHSSGINILFGVRRIPDGAASSLTMIATMLFFLPDLTGSIIYLNQISAVSESSLPVYGMAALGLLIALVVAAAAVGLYRPYGVGTFFDLPQIFLFLAMAKLFGSGIKGVAELTLIPSVQRGLMKFIHDVVHQTFIMLLVPDHPLLKQTTWDFIGILFGPAFASSASLVMLLALPLAFVHHSLFRPPDAAIDASGPEKRKLLAMLLSDRRRKAIPVILFAFIIFARWTMSGGGEVTRMVIPPAEPVVASGGTISIPIRNAARDLLDGALHKFSLSHEGEEIRFMVIKKPDESLAVALDACEICPPEGYGLRGGHVICIYCGTPIPVESLGKPGGCNPIPLEYVADNRVINIKLDELLKKWDFVRLKDGND